MDSIISNSMTSIDSEKLFEKLNSSFTIKEKIEISVIRYDYNYFLESSLEGCFLPRIVLPLQYVTRELYNKHISKDQKAKTKKLSWVLKNKDEEFCTEFRQKYANNEFKSVREAEHLAANIYSKYCDFYQSSKATVQSVNGVKIWTKKRIHIDEENEQLEKNSNESLVFDEEGSNSSQFSSKTENVNQFKRRCLEEFSANLNDFKKNINEAASQFKKNLEKSNIFVDVNVETLQNNCECATPFSNISHPICVNVVMRFK